MSKDKPTGYSPEEWEKIKKGREVAKTPDGEKVTYTEYKKREQEKEQAQKDNDDKKAGNNDKQVHYITGIIYDNPLLNNISEELVKFDSDIKGLLTKALNSVPSSNQSDPVEVCTTPMGDINDMSEG
ncbi:hypothetical protein [Candidatus Tisiphia endosymbiont of Thecophora atra]|uniref:hypothetical protein n=1 Tax=Candidatus Tisiphia endosymbiont of Thecophora atra TaxID=3066258 RepID=UPI00312C81B7